MLPEVVEYLDELGFGLVRKYPAHGSFDSQHDCLFMKKGTESRVVDVVREIYDLAV